MGRICQYTSEYSGESQSVYLGNAAASTPTNCEVDFHLWFPDLTRFVVNCSMGVECEESIGGNKPTRCWRFPATDPQCIFNSSFYVLIGLG